MKNMIQGFVAAALVLAIGLYGWIHYQTQQEVDAGAAYARKSDALVMQQLSMLKDGADVTLADYFAAAHRASDDLSTCAVEIDSREWKRSPDARDAAKAICSAAKNLISTLSVAVRLRFDRDSAKGQSDKAFAAISKSSNSSEIELLKSQMNEAYDKQIHSLDQEIANRKQNRERVQAMLEADSNAVAVLGVPGLSQDIRNKLGGMYPEK